MYQQELARSGEALFNVHGSYLTGYYVYGGIAAIGWMVRLLRRFGTPFEEIS